MEQESWKVQEELDLASVDLEKEGFVEELVAACRDPGVFRVVNHGVPEEVSGRLFGVARDLLEGETKKRQLPGYFWGTPALSLRVKELNWVEGFHLDAGTSVGDAEEDEAFAMLRRVTAEYVVHMARIARKVLDALAGELGLEAEQRASYLVEKEGIFRAYRYPACPSGKYMGMEAHTDSSVVSILNQDMVGGLQVQLHHGDGGPGGRWCRVAPVPGTLVVNMGDMMQAMSGDEFRSVRHRVVAAPHQDRMSLCYFAFPHPDALINSTKYRAFTYREFREQVQADIKATGAKLGLPRFRKGSC